MDQEGPVPKRSQRAELSKLAVAVKGVTGTQGVTCTWGSWQWGHASCWAQRRDVLRSWVLMQALGRGLEAEVVLKAGGAWAWPTLPLPEGTLEHVWQP